MPTRSSIYLLENASMTGPSKEWIGGEATFHVVGTFGGATVTIERLGPDGITWTPIPDTSLTADGMVNLSIGASTVRAAVSGGSPSGLYAVLAGTTR